MGTDDSAIDEVLGPVELTLQVSLSKQFIEDALPDTLSRPATKAWSTDPDLTSTICRLIRMTLLLEHLRPDLELRQEDMYSGRNTPLAPPVSPQDLHDLLEIFPDAPREYIGLLQVHDGITFIEKNPGGVENDVLVMSIFSAFNALHTMTEWYPFLTEQMPNCFFFANDGGDEGYLFGHHVGRTGIYRVGLAYAEWEGATYLAPSLFALLCGNEHLTALY